MYEDLKEEQALTVNGLVARLHAMSAFDPLESRYEKSGDHDNLYWQAFMSLAPFK